MLIKIWTKECLYVYKWIKIIAKKKIKEALHENNRFHKEGPLWTFLFKKSLAQLRTHNYVYMNVLLKKAMNEKIDNKKYHEAKKEKKNELWTRM